MTNLTRASNQWQTRPDDERFWSLEEMQTSLLARRERSRHAAVQSDDIRIIAEGQEILVNGKTGTRAGITHYAFGQVCGRAGAPAGYLRGLPAELAATCLNVGLQREASTETRLLFDSGPEGLQLRAALSSEYERVWDADLVERLLTLQGDWRVPPGRAVDGVRSRPATEDDVLKLAGHASLGIKVGDSISPSGLYASDRDCFAFLVDDGKRIDVQGASLCRGFFAWNSEVGARTIGVETFLFDAVCGNHIVWGAREVKSVRLKHTKQLRDGEWLRAVEASLDAYAESSTEEDRRRILTAQTTRIADTADDVIAKLFNRKDLRLPRRTLQAAFDVAKETPRYGDPRSPWAIANGLTELSQAAKNMDTRLDIDRAAGKILEIAF